jgi:hypothetical protein
VALVKVRPAPICRRAEATERRYLRRAFGHPLNVSIIVVLSVFALAYGAFPWLVLAVALELMGLSALLHTDFFRARAERQLAEAELTQLRLSMEGVQLRELQRLEDLCATIQKAACRPESACPPGLADGEQLRRLLERYLRLSLSHKAGRELIASTDRRALEDEIRSLERSLLMAGPPPPQPSQVSQVRRLQQRRLELARRRIARLERATERVEVVAQQLAAISELIHFLHEQALSPPSLAGDWSDDLESLLGDLDEHELAISEVETVAEADLVRSPA